MAKALTINNKEVCAESKVRTYTISERNWFLLGMAGQNIIYNIIGASLAYYLQFTLLIPAMTVSLIMTLARVWDAFNDPMMGTLVDRTRTKYGKCRPYLMVIPIPIMIVTIMCFTNFGFYGSGTVSNGLIVFWAAFTYVLYGMTYTIGDIPLWGVTSLMTESNEDKTKLLSLARIFGGIGGGVALLSIQAVALALSASITNTSLGGGNAAVGEKYGFLFAAIIFAIAGTLMFAPIGFKIKERINAVGERYSIKDNFKIAMQNKPFRQIIVSGILGSTKMLIALAAIPLVTYYFSSKDAFMAFFYILLLGGGLFIGQFIAMALTPKLLTKYSSKNLYNYSNLAGVLPYALIFVAYLLAPSSLTNFGWIMVCFVLFFICGATMGITTVLQTTMIAKAVDYEEYTNHRRPDAVFFSGQTFVTKLQTGIATILSGLAYAIVGFSDSRVQELNAYITAGGNPRLVGEYGSFMMILFFIVSVLPALGSILTVIPTWNYCLDDKVYNRVLSVLHARRDALEMGITLTQEQEDNIQIVDGAVCGLPDFLQSSEEKSNVVEDSSAKTEKAVKEKSSATKDTVAKADSTKKVAKSKDSTAKTSTKKDVKAKSTKATEADADKTKATKPKKD